MKDAITDVNDRQQFIKMLKSSVQKTNEGKGKLALILIRLNRLQRINQIHDFHTGDAALKFLADKLVETKRNQDYVGRLSGSTFGLVLSGIMNKGHAQLAALKILRLLELPLEINDKRLNLDISIGISLCPTHSSIGTGLLKKAEAALKEANLHEGHISFTPDHYIEELSEFWDIELGIEEAIINSEFKLYYQPKISLKTGLPIGAEALIRWPHPSRGMIMPDQFIPIAEDHGHIKPMTIWILNVALRESTEWTKKWGKLSISVNIPPELMNSELVDLVENAMNIWSPENKLVLEILERSFALSDEKTFKTFQALQDLGSDISIDDFGTGYSALSYFKNIPAKELKIDQSFVRTLIQEQGNLDIVTFIIQLAHAFKMRIVAEGVEDIASAKKLQELGCDYIQGYYLAKPMPHSEFLKWLNNYQPSEQMTFNDAPEKGDISSDQHDSLSQHNSSINASIQNTTTPNDISIDKVSQQTDADSEKNTIDSPEQKTGITLIDMEKMPLNLELEPVDKKEHITELSNQPMDNQQMDDVQTDKGTGTNKDDPLAGIDLGKSLI